MAASVLPGAVVQLLATAEWREHNVVVYESEPGELVVCDDLTLLQVIPLSPKPPRGTPRAALHPESGAIAIATGHSLVLYEAVELFGRMPRWELVLVAADMPAASVAWLDQDRLVATTAARECVVWSIPESRTLWSEPLCARDAAVLVESAPGANMFATFDSTHLIKLWSPASADSVLSFDFDYLPHAVRVELCWFVSPKVLAAVSAGTLFLWDAGARTLIASIILPEGVGRPLVVAKADDIVLVQTGAHSIWQLSLQSKGDGPHASEWSTSFDLGGPGLSGSDPSGSNESVSELKPRSLLYATTRRVYALDFATKALGVYDLASQTPKRIGHLTGVIAGGDKCLSTRGGAVLAGKTVVKMGRAPDVLPIEGGILLSHLVDESTALVVTTQRELLCFAGSTPVWKRRFEAVPILLNSYEAHAVVVFTDQVILADLESGTTAVASAIDAESASVYNNKLLTAYKDTVTLRSFSPSGVAPLAERQVDHAVDKFELSSRLAAVVVRADGSTLLRVWNAADALFDLASIDLGDTGVVCIGWSPRGEFLTVLTSRSLLTFAITRTEPLVQVGEWQSSIVKPTCLSWTEDLDVVLFNGQQLVYRHPVIDDFGHTVLADLGVAGDHSTLNDLRAAINADMPVYHPRVVLAFVLALRPLAACAILGKLWRDLRFADTTPDGVALLDPSLGLTATDLAEPASEISWTVEEFELQLQKTRPLHVAHRDVALLAAIVRTLGDPQRSQHLDEYAIAYHCLLLLGRSAESQARVFAWFSQTKQELLSSVDESSDRNLAFWLGRESLAEITEQRAKAQFAKEREPTAVTLAYVALRKLSVLKMLWRISSGHPEREKTLKFLDSDFTTERWRIAAHKNAYALLSKHRPEYAAAFFLLGDSVTDCCQVLVSKVGSVELAVTVARLYDGDAGKGLKLLGERCFSADAWLRFWCSTLTNASKSETLDQFLASATSDPCAIFVYVAQCGQFDESTRAHWRSLFAERGFSALVCNALVDPLKPNAAAASPPDTSACEPRPEPREEAASSASGAAAGSGASDLENRPLPSHLKPAPTELQLEPDMSAFGF